MRFRELPLKGAFEITLEPRLDARGGFSRVYCEREFGDHGLITKFEQSNLSWCPTRGTLRGLHMQREPHGEVKVVRCTRGAVFDVILDLRPESATFLQWMALELTEHNRNSMYVPVGFAHGYQSLTDDVEVFYMVSKSYAPTFEVGYRWNDPAWKIAWPIDSPIISEKDAAHKDFEL